MTDTEIENAKANLQYDGEAKLSAKYYRSLAIRLLTELETAQKVVERVRQCERNIDLLITDPTRAEVKASYRDCLEPVDTQ